MAKSALASFHPPVAAWFRAALGEPTRPQGLGWKPILDGKSTLILAPTGSGKTLAAFLAALETLMWSPEPDKAHKRARCKVLYVSPLKALAVDVEKNLRAPIAGILQTAASMGAPVRAPIVDIRTGDTPAKDRARMSRTPPDILITTPESLYLMLTSQAQETLASVDVVIVDEIHQLVPSKRGAHLFLSLERLAALRDAPSGEAGRGKSGRPPLQRIGLSATQRPLDEVARLLGGFDDRGKPREVVIVDAGEKKPLELSVRVPDVDLGALGDADANTAAGDDAPSSAPRTLWPHIHDAVVKLVLAHRSTMIFVNSRRLAERLASALNETAGEEIALAHHGSVAREKRMQIEDRLKRGDLRAIVATSSLELGIDMGAVDLVVQVEAPSSIASGLQRVGRACHRVGGVPRGVIFPKHRGDLLACAAATPEMREGHVEETFYPRNPLDVLAQQIVATSAATEGWTGVDDLFALVRRAAPFAELPRSAFEGVLDMLSGRYPADDFAELRPRVTWDRALGRLRAREGARRVAVTNGGTIPDRGLYGVFLLEGGSGGKRVGELDEEMVFEMREGEVFLLGASSWRAEQITHDRVLVTPAAGEPGKMPFWHGDRAGRARGFGERIGELTRRVARHKGDTEAMLRDGNDLDASAATNLVAYVREQVEATGEVPSDRTIVVERTTDELGDFRVCVLTPFGTRVHAPWTIAVTRRLNERFPGEIDVHYTDDGMVFRVPACDDPPAAETFFPRSDEVQEILTASLADTSLFAARFRECAARALLLPRRDPKKRTPLWAQRKRAGDLLAVASQHPSFPIVLETYRECLRDVFDVSGLVEILRRVEARQIRVVTVDGRAPSPFAASVLFSYVANFLYDADAPLAERRAQALTIDHAQLRELLGEAELRQLLDAEVIEEHERLLQRITHPVKHADGLHDMLLAIGDLSPRELLARASPPDAALSWADELVRERRAVRVRIGGEVRLAAAEDVARLRDGLGVVPPPGLPDAFLEPAKNGLLDLVSRYARTHGPFTEKELATRLGGSLSSVGHALAQLVREGKIVEGVFLPRGTTQELCDADVLQALRRKSLSRLRQEVEAVEPAALGRFLPAWHGVGGAGGAGGKRRGMEALLSVIAQLEGAPLVASVLMNEILPARLEDFRPYHLDMLCATGRVVWAGVEPLGAKDGRVALYLAEHEALLAPPPREAEGAVAAKIRETLARRGAVFFADIVREVGGFPADVLEALWDMVWAGELTNDTLEPMRSRLRDEERQNPRARALTRMSRTGPPGSDGRWSLRAQRWTGAATTDTERRTALARALLDRYGVVTREVAHAEGIAGGFSAVYDVLKAMEDAGRARRGYFVAGKGGAQFALAGAEERLRAKRDAADEADAETLVLAATDPANPYGAALDWPEGDRDGGARPQRAAGALVVLHDGALVAWVGRSEQSLLTFLPAEEPARSAAARAVARGLAKLLDAPPRRALLLTRIDGIEAQASPLARHFADAGFAVGIRGLLKRAQPRARRDEPEPDVDQQVDLA